MIDYLNTAKTGPLKVSGIELDKEGYQVEVSLLTQNEDKMFILGQHAQNPNESLMFAPNLKISSLTNKQQYFNVEIPRFPAGTALRHKFTYKDGALETHINTGKGWIPYGSVKTDSPTFKVGFLFQYKTKALVEELIIRDHAGQDVHNFKVKDGDFTDSIAGITAIPTQEQLPEAAAIVEKEKPTNDIEPIDITLDFSDFKLGEKPEGKTGFSNSVAPSEITDEVTFNGKPVAKFNAKKGKTEWAMGGVVSYPKLPAKGITLAKQVYMAIPPDFDFTAADNGNVKFLRDRLLDANGKHQGYNDIYIHNNTMFAHTLESAKYGNKWTRFGENALSYYGEMHEYQVVTTFDTVAVDDGGMGRVVFYKDGKEIANITNRPTLTGDDHLLAGSYLFTYWNGGVPKDQSLYIAYHRLKQLDDPMDKLPPIESTYNVTPIEPPKLREFEILMKVGDEIKILKTEKGLKFSTF